MADGAPAPLAPPAPAAATAPVPLDPRRARRQDPRERTLAWLATAAPLYPGAPCEAPSPAPPGWGKLSGLTGAAGAGAGGRKSASRGVAGHKQGGGGKGFGGWLRRMTSCLAPPPGPQP